MTSSDLTLGEIHEQPEALRRLAGSAAGIEEAGRAVAARAPRLVRLAGHGSSANAAAYGATLFGHLTPWPAMRESLSRPLLYGIRRPAADTVLIALSQSGRTPDVVRAVELEREAGALTIAMTNDVRSPLAAAAEISIDVRAGVERALAATKSYVNQLAALALLVGAAGGRSDVAGALAAVADRQEEALAGLGAASEPVVDALRHVEGMFVVARGVEHVTAREAALKLTELCRMAAVPLTSAGLLHGPVVAVGARLPVWAVTTGDAALPSVIQAARRARELGATVVACGDAAAAVPGAVLRLPTPAVPVPWLAALVSILPAQLVAVGIARAQGFDLDRDSDLGKVTHSL